MKPLDIVVRKSYGKDITFRVIEIKETDEGTICMLNGLNLRIVADAPIEDLEKIIDGSLAPGESLFNRRVNKSIRNIIESRALEELKGENRSFNILKNTAVKQVENMIFKRPGKVLHIDGDANYLDICLKVYKQLDMVAIGKVVPEKEQPEAIVEIVKDVKPDIVVITGHDSISKEVEDYMDLDNYRNSKYFVQSVAKLRDIEPDYDTLVIYAGACQSCYEAILDAGANFSSSPERVLIHCLDPVFICEKVAYTNVNETVSIHEAVRGTITGSKGIGGIQTRGKCRTGYPRSIYS